MLNIVKLIFICTLGFLSGNHVHAESLPLYRNSISVQLGAYQLKSSKSTLSSLGSLNFQYDYHFTEKWYGSAAYQFIVQSAGGFSSLVSGFDVGGHYCVFACIPVRSEVGGMIEVTEESKFGLAVGVGFSGRSFQLTTQSVGYSGPFAELTADYYLGSKWKIVSSLQVLKLSNGPNELNAQVFGLGLGLDF